MIWKNGLTWEAKKAKRENWHTWCAWRPVVVGISDDNRKIKCWLETVERKGKLISGWHEDWWEWEYRKPGSHKEEK